MRLTPTEEQPEIVQLARECRNDRAYSAANLFFDLSLRFGKEMACRVATGADSPSASVRPELEELVFSAATANGRRRQPQEALLTRGSRPGERAEQRLPR